MTKIRFFYTSVYLYRKINESKILMTNNKSIVEEALLQMEHLQDAITENAKGILASTMKEEIRELVKESLNEVENETLEGEDISMMEQGTPEDEVDNEEEGMEDLEDEEGMEDLEDEEEMDDTEFDMENMSDMEDTEMPDELDIDDESEELLPLDLTSASDTDIIKIFKAMGPEDGIKVVKQNDNIEISDEGTGNDYILKLSESEESIEGDEDEVIYELEIDDEESEELEEMDSEMEGEEVLYELELDDEEGLERSDDSEEEEEYAETKEGRVRSNSLGRRTATFPSNYPKERRRPALRNEELEKEISSLREKNEEYRKALNIFREKLNEVAVFNSNLAYATRLFTEHSTTKQEKINILRRFDGVETLKESKSLYKIIKEDLSSKEDNIVTESIESKVQKSPSRGSASNLIESKTYENPQFLRMKDLMNKIK
jgi:hypothetical protein